MDPADRARSVPLPEDAVHADEHEFALNPQPLQPGVDYLYCADCGHHIPSIRLQRGVWEVQCPRCAGECGLCGCRRSGVCVGPNDAPVATHMYVARQEKP